MPREYSRVLRYSLVALAAIGGSLSGISSAWALGDSDKEAIRQLSNDAATDFNAGQFERAREKFSRAYDVARVPRLAVWIARSYERAGKLVSAYEHYRQAVRLEKNELWVGDAQEQAQREAEKELAALIPRLPRIQIEVRGVPASTTQVRVDDTEVPTALLGVERFVDPGKHEVIGTANGTVVRESVTLDAGARLTVALQFEHAPAAVGAPPVDSKSNQGLMLLASTPTSDPKDIGAAQRTWGWISIGVGSVGLLTGATAGLVVASKHSALSRDCPDGSCDSANASRVESYRTMRMVSTIGFVVGGIGAATGVTLLLLAPKPSAASAGGPSLALWAAPGVAGVKGAF